MGDREAIVESLSQRQKASLLAARNLYMASWIVPEFEDYRRVTALSLARKGLAQPFLDGPGFELTELGKSVRALLAAQLS